MITDFERTEAGLTAPGTAALCRIVNHAGISVCGGTGSTASPARVLCFQEALAVRYQTAEKMFPALGTLNTISIRCPEDQADGSVETLRSVRSMVLHLDGILSLYRESSEISAVNRSAGVRPCGVSRDTYEIFRAAISCSEMTGGAFDITAGSLSLLWKENLKQKRLPGFLDRRAAMRRTGWRNVLLSDALDASRRSVFLKKPGMTADLGGIAKGYAADRAREILQAAGVTEATINFGGTVSVIGPEREIGIQNPFYSRSAGEKIVGKLKIQNQAAVTSGSYEQYCVIGGRKYHHIIDPRTGYPAESGLLAVTLVGADAMELDALATGCFVLGAAKSVPVLRTRGIGGIFICEDGSILLTEDLKPKFQLSSSAETGTHSAEAGIYSAEAGT